MAYLTKDEALAAYREGVKNGTIGRCPKCGSPNLSGLIAPDFESRRCDDCGKVSDQWRIREGISAVGLDGQTDGGSPGPQGGSAHSGEEFEPPRVVHPRLRDRKYQATETSAEAPASLVDEPAAVLTKLDRIKGAHAATQAYGTADKGTLGYKWKKSRPQHDMSESNTQFITFIHHPFLGIRSLPGSVEHNKIFDKHSIDNTDRYDWGRGSVAVYHNDKRVHVANYKSERTSAHDASLKDVISHLSSKHGFKIPSGYRVTTRSMGEADVVPFSGSGPTTILDPNASLPWQRRKKVKKENRVRTLPASYYAFRNESIGLPESVQVAEWMDDLLDDADALGYKHHASNRGSGGQVTHVFKHPGTGNSLHINDGPHPTDKHWMIRSKSGDTLHQGSADADHDWFLDRTGPMKNKDFTKQTWAIGKVNKPSFAHESLSEESGFMVGSPTDATQIGKIMIRVLDNVNLQIYAPSRILEQVEAYKFFEQFQMLIPKTPMLSIRVMESIASWWRNYAEIGDLLEIDCTSGLASVTNRRNNRFYVLGTLGSIPSASISV